MVIALLIFYKAIYIIHAYVVDDFSLKIVKSFCPIDGPIKRRRLSLDIITRPLILLQAPVIFITVRVCEDVHSQRIQRDH